MRATALATYTTSGAAAGALFTGLGAVVCHTAAPDRFDRAQATLAGLVGGAVTHAALGLVAALDHRATAGRHIAHLGASLPLAMLTSGVVGGAVLGKCGYPHPEPGDLVLAGVVGGALVAVVSGVAALVSFATCTQRPQWTRIATGDLGQGEALLGGHPAPTPQAHGGAHEENAHPAHGRRSLAERILPWERRSETAPSSPQP